MLRFARLFVVLALALAVPLQAMSAVTASICMASDHHAGAVHSHDGDDQHSHDHESAPTSASHEHEGAAGQDSSAHCGPCAACCASAAISSAAPTLVPQRPAALPVAAQLDSAAGFQPDGVYRPPLAL